MKVLITVNSENELRKRTEILDDNEIIYAVQEKTLAKTLYPECIEILVSEGDYETALKLIED